MNENATLVRARAARELVVNGTNTRLISPAIAPALAPCPDPIVVFTEQCEARALLYANSQIQLQHAVDGLQTIAEQSGLIALIGQDAVQQIMGKEFAAVRNCQLPEQLPDELDDACEKEIMLRAADLVRQWEMADPRDAWRHTDEPKPKAPTPEPTRPYRTPEATVAAFKYVLKLNDPEYLERWLANHPKDAPYLYNLWKGSRR
jgi:hypothetical protein